MMNNVQLMIAKVGDNLKAIMEKKGITAYKLGELCKAKGHTTTKVTILNIVRCKKFSFESLASIADALDVNIVELVG